MSDDSVLTQHLDGRLDSVDSLRTDTWDCLSFILSEDEVLHDLVTFSFVTLHHFSMEGGGGVTQQQSRSSSVSFRY